MVTPVKVGVHHAFTAAAVRGRIGVLSTKGRQALGGLSVVALFALAPIIVPYVSSMLTTERPVRFIEHTRPVPVREVSFRDAEGRTRTLGEFRGRMTVLNVWATWCVPCRREMPSLDRLQSLLGGDAFQVLALSIDRGGLGPVERFFRDHRLTHLVPYVDESGNGAGDLGAVGIPTTLLLDADGLEWGRLIGPAEWDAPSMLEFLKARIAATNVLITNPDSR